MDPKANEKKHSSPMIRRNADERGSDISLRFIIQPRMKFGQE